MPHAMQIRQTGAPEVLNWVAVDVGEPGSGRVRLRQAAARLNYIRPQSIGSARNLGLHHPDHLTQYPQEMS
jgi:hypothetical protein